MAQYTFNNGSGQFTNIKPGSHTIDKINTIAVGYNLDSLPNSFTVDSHGSDVAITIGATGDLYLKALLDGGTETVPNLVFTRVYTIDSTVYGTATTDTNGIAVFNHVPFAATGAPYIYYSIDANSDYELINPVAGQNYARIALTETTTEETAIEVAVRRKSVNANFTLTDTNYAGLPIETGTLYTQD